MTCAVFKKTSSAMYTSTRCNLPLETQTLDA